MELNRQTWYIGKDMSVLLRWWRLASAWAALRWSLIRVRQALGVGEPRQWRVRPRRVRYALTARLRGSSDMKVFWQIFTFDEYSVLRNLQGVSLVLDLGANVGYSSAYFLSCFPGARVVAVEPDDQNVAVCRANLKPYGDRALVLHGAVWSGTTSLSLSNGAAGDGNEWARRVTQAPEGAAGKVQAWDVGTLIDKSGAKVVGLLKVDIEGAELEVFGTGASAWLTKIRNICIELHGPDCEEAFFNALAGFDYDLEHSGELTICRNMRPGDSSVRD